MPSWQSELIWSSIIVRIVKVLALCVTLFSSCINRADADSALRWTQLFFSFGYLHSSTKLHSGQQHTNSLLCSTQSSRGSVSDLGLLNLDIVFTHAAPPERVLIKSEWFSPPLKIGLYSAYLFFIINLLVWKTNSVLKYFGNSRFKKHGGFLFRKLSNICSRCQCV